MNLGELDLEAAAKEAAGNWRCFGNFAWHRARDLVDAENWAIFYTHNRDSDLLKQSNADFICLAMQPFLEADDPDVMFERHDHWAVGWLAGYAVRVYRDGEITKAFSDYHDLLQRLVEYAVLDEDGYDRLVYATTLENLQSAAWQLTHEYDLPEGWEPSVYDWLEERDAAAVENRDDRGGYPSEEQFRQAFEGLGYAKREETQDV